jgi:hypothetical protein
MGCVSILPCHPGSALCESSRERCRSADGSLRADDDFFSRVTLAIRAVTPPFASSFGDLRVGLDFDARNGAPARKMKEISQHKSTDALEGYVGEAGLFQQQASVGMESLTLLIPDA